MTKEKPIIGIIIKGGLVQDVVANCELDTRVLIIDHDIEGMDRDDLVRLPSEDNSTRAAFAHIEDIVRATFDLAGAFDIVSKLERT